MDTPVTGTPRTLLRIEGLAALVASVTVYAMIDGSWMLFALLLLVPDLAIAGYIAGPRTGAVVYNTLHTYAGPAVLAALGHVDILPGAWPVCLIWLAHIGLDRSLGLGLKYPDAFQSTHLGYGGRATSMP